MKVLIIGNDASVTDTVSLYLQLRWPDIELFHAYQGNTGIETLKSEPIDIVILDINLPDISGFDVLENIRTFSNVPVIILSVREDEDEKVMGLEMGADDYIITPFSPRDFIARVNAVLRRANIVKDITRDPLIVRGNITLNLTSDEVHFGKETTVLTPNETKVLYTLMRNAESIVSSEEISRKVWGGDYKNSDRVRTYIRRLRYKLKDEPPELICNKRGQGYTFIGLV